MQKEQSMEGQHEHLDGTGDYHSELEFGLSSYTNMITGFGNKSKLLYVIHTFIL